MPHIVEWAVMYLKSSLSQEWMEWSVYSLLERRHLYNISFSICGCSSLFLQSHSCKCDAIICRQTQPGQTALKAFCPLYFCFVSPSFLENSSMWEYQQQQPWELGGITSALYQTIIAVWEASNKPARAGTSGHKDEMAASCLKIVQIISSTHILIEAVVAMETHPPSPFHRVCPEKGTFPSNRAAQNTNPKSDSEAS